jgi:hypothetical protein
MMKKVTAAFDGGRLSSDGGVMLLCEAERRLGIAARLAGLFPDDRDGTRVIHRVSDVIRARIFAIAGGYEDCNDFETPAGELEGVAGQRRPDSDPDLASQPNMSRLENASARGDPSDLAVRVQETASRIRLAYAASCPEAALVRGPLPVNCFSPFLYRAAMPSSACSVA